MKYKTKIKINENEISINSKPYFIADIASNHNGDLEQAKNLIWLAKEAGADAVKFQHFLADKIVSDYGFKSLGANLGHQSSWGKSVYEIYKESECHRDWTQALVETAQKAEIDFLTTPYDLDAVNLLDPYIPAYKIGSGDITWLDFIASIAKKDKPVLLATGASSMDDVIRAVDTVLQHNPNIVLMQCNTNYSGEIGNFKYINLNVLKTYEEIYPKMVLGLSDHTPGHATVLGAIALGARVIEKHFTSNNSGVGPDHAFSMNPTSWKDMILRATELNLALGNSVKKIEENERETVILQRRCIRLNCDLDKNSMIEKKHIEYLRPAPLDAIFPYQEELVIGKRIVRNKREGEYLSLNDFNGREYEDHVKR